MENSIITTLLLERLGVRYVIARAENNKHGEILKMIGADRVVYPEPRNGRENRTRKPLWAISLNMYRQLPPLLSPKSRLNLLLRQEPI